MTKDYTNTREPGEFGDGVTVELEPNAIEQAMTDAELIRELEAFSAYSDDLYQRAADRLKSLKTTANSGWGVKVDDLILAMRETETDFRDWSPEAQDELACAALEAIEPAQAPEDENEKLERYDREIQQVLTAPAPAELERYHHRPGVMCWHAKGIWTPYAYAQSALAAKDEEIDRLAYERDVWRSKSQMHQKAAVGRTIADERAEAAEARNAELVKALELALQYWADRQQRYKNRNPVWVQNARAALGGAAVTVAHNPGRD